MTNNIRTVALFLLTVVLLSMGYPKKGMDIKRPPITGIAYAAFFTKNVESSRKFYTNYLGFAEPFSVMAPNKKDLSFTNFKINDWQFVEIFPEKIKGGNRLNYFAIETTDAEAMRKYLVSKGVRVPKKIAQTSTGNKGFFITDPNGTLLEIIQYQPQIREVNNIGKDLAATRIAARISHVGFMVPDADKAIAFYCGILGFKEIWRGGKDAKNVTWVNLQVPDGKDYIELMLYDKEQSEENMGVLNHICLEVADVTVSAATLANKTLPQGCKQTTAMKTGINKKRQINCFDIDGTRVEIMESKTIDGQPAPSSAAPPLKFISH
ncbi:hypothetical protein BH11BAC3_BH11BAC3_16720 [soil metagenome]